jgi:hypothetical protein
MPTNEEPQPKRKSRGKAIEQTELMKAHDTESDEDFARLYGTLGNEIDATVEEIQGNFPNK